MTDFPTKGEDLTISLRNSNLPQFDYEFALMVKEDHPAIWKTGGNIRGNDAFRLWTKARQGDESSSVLDWIKERESWGARHGGDGSQFPEDSPTMSNIAGVVASMKWGVILDIGESLMKEMVRELIEKTDERAWDDNISESIATALKNKVEQYNEEIDPDDTVHRATLPMMGECFRRGVGAYKTNPESVRPSVSSPEQWGLARCNSLLYALKNEKFRSGKHDTDLLPAGHPLKTKGSEDEDERAKVGEIDGKPAFSTPEEANAYAEKIGCSGHHSMKLDGETVFMPCKSHSEITDDDGDGYRTKSNTMERRFISTKIESRQDTPETQDEQRVEGYASVFNQSTDLGAFTESIGENAFQDVMNDDVRMLFNHDPNFPLARSRNGEGTLDMKVDENGVFFSFPVGPQTYAKDLHESIKRGDVDEASFAFTVMDDEWEERDGKPHRHITRLGQLIDLSVCTYGAYQQTEVMVRSLPEIPLNENKNNELETEQKRDRVKWAQSMLELQKLKTKIT